MERNVFETELNGQKIGFKCGTLAIAIACREAKVKSIQELIGRMASEDLLAILALFYGCACQYAGKNSNDLTMEIVGEWIEQMGEETCQKCSKVLLEKLIPKNIQAPQAGAMENQ